MNVLDQIKRAIEAHNVVIIKIYDRLSESYYNYKLVSIWIYYKGIDWENSDDVREFSITTGFFQEHTREEVETFLKDFGFVKIWQA